MIHVTAYQRNNPKKGRDEEVTILLDPADGYFYHKAVFDGGEEMFKLPHASMYVYPHVPRPSSMQTEQARKITLCAMQWISNQLTKRGHHE